jgi:hypothetical protein
MLPTLAFVLVTGFTSNTGAMTTIVVPGLADENECHKLALKINAPRHGCFEYRMATPPPTWLTPFKMSCRTTASLGEDKGTLENPHAAG